jgi:hypothetical protein
VRGDQHGEPGQAKDPGQDDVGEPVVAEEDPAEPIAAAQATASTTHRAMPTRLLRLPSLRWSDSVDFLRRLL